MIIKIEPVVIQGETLQFTNQRAIYWKKQHTLILSDLHIGKTAHFRRSGIPISSRVLLNDLSRLEMIIKHFKAQRIVVVGDMFHAEQNEDVQIFSKWLQDFNSLEWILIKGNHDKWNADFYKNLSIELIPKSFYMEPFILIHDVLVRDEKAFYITGHIHPGVNIKSKGKQCIKLPCYHLSENQLLLPAFSLFTGLNTRNNNNNKPFVQYAFTENSIFKI